MIGTLFGRALLLVLLISGCAYLLYTLDPVLYAGASQRRFWVNFLPVAVTFFAFYILSGRIFLAAALTAAITWLLYFIHDQKMYHLEEPLIFSDVFLLPQIINGWHLMSQYLVWQHMVITGVAFLLFFLFFRFEKPHFKARYSALMVVAGTLLLMNVTSGQRVSAGLSSISEGGFYPWNHNGMVEEHGLLPSLVIGASLVSFTRPNVSHSDIERFKSLHQIKPVMSMPGSPPDIILWLSESFFDPAVMQEIDDCEVWQEWCELLATGLHGGMLVPTYGGNTTRTEFEVLTSIPFSSLGRHDYPYTSVVNSPLSSIVWQLKQFEYSTLAIHSHDPTFWQRDRAYPFLGFDDYWADRHEIFRDASREGYFISDKVLTDIVIGQLESDVDHPRFIFTVSMENHGPWGRRPNVDEDKRDGFVVPESTPVEHQQAFKEYLYHGQNAVDELNRLYRFIQSRDRPTLLVFFGDHLPGLTEIFESIGFDDGKVASLQKLPFVALANYPLEHQWMPDYAHQMGPWVLGLANQLGDDNYRELHAIYEYFSSSPMDPESDAGLALRAMQARQFYPLPPRSYLSH